MIKSLKQKFKTLYHNALKELYEKPIATLAILLTLFPLYLMVKYWQYVLYFLSKTLSKTIVVNLYILVTVFLLLLWALYLLLKESIRTKRSFEFLDYQGLLWKIINPKSHDFKVDYPSYCKTHKVQHFSAKSKIFCPICAGELTSDIDVLDLHFIYDAVKKLKKAAHNKHIKIYQHNAKSINR